MKKEFVTELKIVDRIWRHSTGMIGLELPGGKTSLIEIEREDFDLTRCKI